MERNRPANFKKSIFLLAQVAIVVLGAAGIGTMIWSYYSQRALSSGIRYLRNNQLLEARDILEDIYSLDPMQKARTQLYLGQISAGFEHFSNASVLLENGLKQVQSDKYYFLLGNTYLRLGSQEKAIEALKKSYWYNPRFTPASALLTEILLDRARSVMDTGNMRKAFELIQQSMRFDHRNSKSYLLASLIELESNRIKDAMKWLERGLLYQPGDLALHLQLLKSALISKSYDKTIEIIRVLSIHPDQAVREELINHLFALSYEPVHDPSQKILLSELLIQKGSKIMACNLLQELDPGNDTLLKAVLESQCTENPREKVRICSNIEELTEKYPVYFRLLDRYSKNCHVDVESNTAQSKPVVFLYRPLLYGNKMHKLMLLGYTAPANWEIEKIQSCAIELYLLSVDNFEATPDLWFRINNDEKTIFIRPENSELTLKTQWEPFELRNFRYNINIPLFFQQGNFRISVSFASQEMKEQFGKPEEDVGFVPLFRIERSGNRILVTPGEPEFDMGTYQELTGG